MGSKHRQKSINDSGWVYILHFTDKLSDHAQHYVGFSKEPVTRMMNHINGYTRVRIIEACHEQGIGMVPSVIIPVPSRRSERALKDIKNTKFYCKFCSPKKYQAYIDRFIRKELAKHNTMFPDGPDSGQGGKKNEGEAGTD